MRTFLRSVQSCCKGATAIEYALIAGVMSVALVVGVTIVGDELSELFELVAESF